MGSHNVCVLIKNENLMKYDPVGVAHRNRKLYAINIWIINYNVHEESSIFWLKFELSFVVAILYFYKQSCNAWHELGKVVNFSFMLLH